MLRGTEGVLKTSTFLSQYARVRRSRRANEAGLDRIGCTCLLDPPCIMSSCRHQKRTTKMTTANHKAMGSDSSSINACRCRRSQLKPLKWLQQVINAWSAVTSYATCCNADPTVIIWCDGYGDVGIMSNNCTETPPWPSSKAAANTSPSARRSKLPPAPPDWDWLLLLKFLLACAADLERLPFKNCLTGGPLTRTE